MRVNQKEASTPVKKGMLNTQSRNCIMLVLLSVGGHKFGQRAMRKTLKLRIAEIMRYFFFTKIIL